MSSLTSLPTDIPLWSNHFPYYQIFVHFNTSRRFKWEMCAIGSGIWKLGPQLVGLFVEVMEPLQRGALLKEIYYWGQALRFYNLVSLPFSSLSSFLCVWVISWHPAARPYSCFPDMVDSVPLELYAKINPFLLQVLQVLLSYHIQNMQPIRTACRSRQ